MSRRVVILCLACAALAVPEYFMGRFLLGMIRVINNLLFHGTISTAVPSTGPLEAWGIFVPMFGALIIGFVARYGSKAVRGHGIPEVIETIVTGKSKIPLKIAILKPLCAAISIGSGGPFGAEGPVIGLGGSMGSLVGQWFTVTARERKILLSAGAAAGITAVFGCPVAAMLLSLELLLFEFNIPSLVAVGFASTVAACLRIAMLGTMPIFPMPTLAIPADSALTFYIMLGIPLGLAAVAITYLVHEAEHLFTKLPIHWMWWPALGGLMVGIVAYWQPRVLGPGYATIADTLSGNLIGWALLFYVLARAFVWITALGSGTAGGTLAPLFGIGGSLGALLTWGAAALVPAWGLDPRMGALVGMAAVFAGASRAMLASIVIALETTQQFSGVVALFGACLLASGTAHWILPNSLMNENLARKGIKLPPHHDDF